MKNELNTMVMVQKYNSILRLEFLLDYGKEDCRWRETTDATNGGRKGARL